MNKPIHQVAVDVLKAAGKPMSTAEIYAAIVKDGLYEFKAKAPKSVLRSQLRRHTTNIAVANREKSSVFNLDKNDRFSLS